MLSKSLKRFRSSFDIVQFSRSCLLSRSSLFIISGKREFVKHFFDFSLSRSVEPLSFVTALIYYHGLERLSTLFFHFLENSRQRLVFMCFAFCPVRLFTRVLYSVLYIIYRKDRTCQSKQGKAIPPPFPAATMRCRLIRPFGPPSPQGEGFDCAVSLASHLQLPHTRSASHACRASLVVL